MGGIYSGDKVLRKSKNNDYKESKVSGFPFRSSVIKREDKINEGDIVLIGTGCDKKRLHWLLGRVLNSFQEKME
ncbi:hypothetical protein TNCV_1488441 [Trichonephila clavipes]|nr:hypothetical protein TNCV_1488441 [Trichonephila clavipes]